VYYTVSKKHLEDSSQTVKAFEEGAEDEYCRIDAILSEFRI
jgi:hypothetical protein